MSVQCVDYIVHDIHFPNYNLLLISLHHLFTPKFLVKFCLVRSIKSSFLYLKYLSRLELLRQKLSNNMASRLLRSLIYAFALGYGVFTVFLYGIFAIRFGYFFRKTTEKEALDLQLGEWLPLAPRWLHAYYSC